MHSRSMRATSRGVSRAALGMTLLGAVVPLATRRAGAQRLAESAVHATVDSQRVLRDARRAQEGFERTRRANLPQSYGGSGGRCDVRVGRFCYWHDGEDYDGPEEPKKIAQARERFLTQLAGAAERLPGDEWIIGQRVRYLVEHGRAQDAAALASACTAREAWCAALRGFALHAASDFAGADSAFSAALAAMDEAERCRWTDITLLLEGVARERYEKLSCTERASFERTFWALSRPLHLLPANDLRTEHLARLTMTELQRAARSPHHLRWGDDMHELMVRYGWAKRWSREAPSLSLAHQSDVSVVGYEPTPTFDFVPAAEVLVSLTSAHQGSWELRDPLARTRYAPEYVRSFGALPYQVALFRRGDSTVVVAGFDVRGDSAFARDTMDAALAAARVTAPESAAVVVRRAGARTGALRLDVPWDTLLVTVEARDSAASRVARTKLVARHPVPRAGARVRMSDILLFDGPDSLPANLEEAIARARGALRVRASEPVGVFWETYGVDSRGETLSYTLTVSQVGTPWYRRAAERAGIVDRRAPVRMKWDEPSARPGAERARALAVDLATLTPGRYRLELTLEAEGQPGMTVSREIQVDR